MANQKRQRQDALRAQKLQQLEQQSKKATANKKRNRILLFAALAAVLVLGLAIIPALRDSANDDSVSAGAKPKIEVPAGNPPKELQTVDLEKGKGKEIVKGSNVQIKYVGVSWLGKEEFDSNWDADGTLAVTVGAGNVIKGWDEGLVGLRQGGTRKLIIPADKGYGKESPTPKIKPNDTLIFVVKAMSVSDPTE